MLVDFLFLHENIQYEESEQDTRTVIWRFSSDIVFALFSGYARKNAIKFWLQLHLHASIL